MKIRTHQQIDTGLCGRVKDLGAGRCTVEFLASPGMSADPSGLVHGGFIFGAADYAAMLAVNEPNVVVARAEVRFRRPCRVGDRLEVHARLIGEAAPKPTVLTVALNDDGEEVFRGTFMCAVPSRHVLDPVP